MDKALVYETRDSEFDPQWNRYFLNLYVRPLDQKLLSFWFGSRFRNQKEERRETNKQRFSKIINPILLLCTKQRFSLLWKEDTPNLLQAPLLPLLPDSNQTLKVIVPPLLLLLIRFGFYSFFILISFLCPESYLLCSLGNKKLCPLYSGLCVCCLVSILVILLLIECDCVRDDFVWGLCFAVLFQFLWFYCYVRDYFCLLSLLKAIVVKL